MIKEAKLTLTGFCNRDVVGGSLNMCFANASLQIIFHVFAKFFECRNEKLIELLKGYGQPTVGVLDATSFVRGLLDVDSKEIKFPEYDDEGKGLQHRADEFLLHLLNCEQWDTLLSTTVVMDMECSSCPCGWNCHTNNLFILQVNSPPKPGKQPNLMNLINSNAESKAHMACIYCRKDTLVRKVDWFAGKEQPALLTFSMALFSKTLLEIEDMLIADQLNKNWEGCFALVAMVCCIDNGTNSRHYTAAICIDEIWWTFDDEKVEKIPYVNLNKYKSNATIVFIVQW